MPARYLSNVSFSTAATALLALSGLSQAATFTVANNTNAGSYGVVTGQGFSAVATDSSTPTTTGATVYLTQFQFFKADPAAADSGSNFSLVVFNTAYPNLGDATATAAAKVGTSTNSISSTAGYTSGQAVTFNFDSLPLVYGNTYSVGLFSGAPSSSTAVTISALTANYENDGTGNYFPTTNYGGTDNYQAAAYGGVTGGYYSAYSHAGDTNFYATLSTTPAPEPATLACLAIGGAGMVMRRRK